MVRRPFSAAFAAAVLAGTAFAQKCTKDSKCPEDTPCCSLYGDCGVGAFCLGGCDPLMSHSFESCVPAPVCKSAEYKMDSLDDVTSIDKYFGDSDEANWQSQGDPKIYQDNSLLLTLYEGTSGTLLASTHYVWYGKVCAKMTTSQGQGVVTAFILMSDVKDEIDFEWIGTDIKNSQSNYYSQGVTVYTNGKNITGGGDTVSEPHDYCIDWTPDQLTWSIDGDDLRSVKRSDTWNKSANRFDYPQTPSRVMISLWPAGLPSNDPGTIEWAGGEIDWNSPYMTAEGYYAARVWEVSVDCYDPPDGVEKDGDKSYVYTDEAGTNNTVKITDDLVVLGSLMGTGEDPGEASKSSDGPAPTNSVAMVPGGNPGGGNRQEPGDGQDTTATGGASNPQQTESGGGGSGGDGGSGFNQGVEDDTGSGSSLEPGLGKMSGSIAAIVVAVLGLMVL